MKQLLLALALGLAFVLPRASHAEEPNGPEIEAVIRSQIEAFSASDVTRVFTFASPMIQRQFRDPGIFGHMVEKGYPMVWRATDLEFLKLNVVADQARQRVLLRDRDGVYHLLEYTMVELDDGWRINGVQTIRTAGQGA